MARVPSTLRWRLTLWYIVLLGVPLIAFAVGGYILFARTLDSRTDRFISDALQPFSREIVAERRVAAGILPAMRSTADEVRFRDLHITIFDNDLHVLAMTPSIGEHEADAPPASDAWIAGALHGLDLTTPQAVTVHLPAGTFRIVSSPFTYGDERFVLAGTYSLRDIDAMLARVRQVFIVAIPLLILAAAFGGYVVTARSLAPVSLMGARASAISATNLEERLPVTGSEELARLARVINGLLDRIEASFSLQRRFMADASHELRTPAAIMRTEADVTLAQPHRSEDEYRASVGVIRDAARRITRIVDDLFLLARTDAGNVVARPEPIDLEDLVDNAARAVRPLAGERGVRLTLHELIEAPVEGDPDQLSRVLLNLLDNAIKHSPVDGTVAIRMRRVDGTCAVSVIDGGTGIPPEAHERVFERFFRVETARSRAERTTTSGAGLGLPIARRIAELHGGSVELVASRPGHTEFRVVLPLRASV